MAPKLKHPFLEGLNDIPEGKKKEMQKIKLWISSQAHLPEISEDYIYLFLHACYYSLDKTKSAIDNYFTIRANHPAIFRNRDYLSIRMQTVMDMGHLLRLPQTTPEGYRIILYSVRDPDPTKLNFSDAVKAFCMFNDVVLSLDGLQEGYIVIFDMRGVQIGHLARVNLPALRCFMHYIQEAHPCRLKQIHVLNTATWIHHVMRLVIPLVKSEILNLVKFHKGNVPENFPLELLPQNYGGEQKTVEELNEQTKNVMLEYVHWLIESGEFISDETKRVKKSSWWGFLAGTNKSAETAELDEKTILKNLQID